MIRSDSESKVALVIPWFGRSLKGGAEQQAWNLAVRLSARGHTVEVLTTCCRSFQDDWASNHYPPGLTKEPEGFSTRRFPVEPRDRAEFDRVCSHLLSLDLKSLKPGVSPISDEDEAIFREHLIRCPALVSHLKDAGSRYAAFIFLPYLYGPILDGLPWVAERAFLQPCLHDEAYAYLRCVQRAVLAARGLLWLSEGEYALGQQLFGPSIIGKSTVGLAGVEPHAAAIAPTTDALRQLQPFVLLLGRKDLGKGTLHAVEAFRAYRRNAGATLNLVVAGPGEMNLADPAGGIHDLGLVSEEVRLWLLNHATALLQPSPNESFSRVIFEAWFCSRPVIARRSCLATARAVQACSGGWVAELVDEWAGMLGRLESMSPGELDAAGRRGATYATEIADWSRVMGRYDIVLRPLTQPAVAPRNRLRQAIHQVLPNLSYGDAIGNHTVWIRNQLRSLGYQSEIFARHIAPAMLSEAFSYDSPDRIPADAAIIYHHSIGTEITPWVSLHPGPKALIYHNITPAKFFEPYRPEFAEILRHGREELPRLAPHFPHSVGDSRFNADELAASGFAEPGVLPLCIDPAQWSFPPDEELMASLQDGRTNILFVGRVVPNKRHEDLIYTFKFWLEEDPEARLFLVGTAEVSSFYLECLQELARRLRVEHAVHFVGHVNDRQLHAYYRCASMFWCFSEHEGFCVPIIEACAFGVPVVARAEGAVPDTLGDAGLLLPTRSNPATTARWIAANRPTDRAKMRARVDQYSTANVSDSLQRLVEKLLNKPQPSCS